MSAASTSDRYTAPHWSSAALVVVDLQVDFLDDGAATVPGTTAIVPNVVALAAAWRAAGLPIAHVVRLYEPGGSDVDLPRRGMIEAGKQIVAPSTPGAEIADGVLPTSSPLDSAALLSGELQAIGEHEVVLFKPRWSGFYRTRLEEWLRQKECDTVVVAGCNLPNCPRATLFDASERDFRTVLVTDAVSRVSPERVADLEKIGVRLHTTDQVMALLP